MGDTGTSGRGERALKRAAIMVAFLLVLHGIINVRIKWVNVVPTHSTINGRVNILIPHDDSEVIDLFNHRAIHYIVPRLGVFGSFGWANRLNHIDCKTLGITSALQSSHSYLIVGRGGKPTTCIWATSVVRKTVDANENIVELERIYVSQSKKWRRWRRWSKQARHLAFIEVEWERLVKETTDDSTTEIFKEPRKLQPLNIRIEEQLWLAYIVDYWDDKIVLEIATLLWEYVYLFPQNLIDIKGIKGELERWALN